MSWSVNSVSLSVGEEQIMAAERHDPDLGRVQFLTVAEVAAMMRVSKMTVYRLVHAGEMPAARVGRSFRVPRQAVEEYLRSSYSDAGDPELDTSR